jgi:ABC-type methionine transport system permease subunit
VIWQLLYANRLINLVLPWSSRTNRTVGFLIILSVLSALVNAISRSPLERWNAIPALMVALGFYLLRRSSR